MDVQPAGRVRDPLERHAGAHADAGLAILPERHFPVFADDADDDACRDRARRGLLGPLPVARGSSVGHEQHCAPAARFASAATAASTASQIGEGPSVSASRGSSALPTADSERLRVAGERRAYRRSASRRSRRCTRSCGASRSTNHFSTRGPQDAPFHHVSRLTLASRSSTSESGCSLAGGKRFDGPRRAPGDDLELVSREAGDEASRRPPRRRRPASGALAALAVPAEDVRHTRQDAGEPARARPRARDVSRVSSDTHHERPAR